jgi:uncharacterized protein (TIGR02453 family)
MWAVSLQTTFDFLAGLRENNNKTWFEDHRQAYNAASEAFEALIADVLVQFHQVDDFAPMSPKDVIHRIHRDVRFSKDKSPYNTGMSALIGPEGRKSTGRAYYIRLEPGDKSIIASGAFGLSSGELQQVREAIAQDAGRLKAILESEAFRRYFGAVQGEQLKTAPKGFPADHPHIDLLRYKEFLAEHPVSDAAAMGADFAEQIIAACLAAKPLTMYFHDILGERARPTPER